MVLMKKLFLLIVLSFHCLFAEDMQKPYVAKDFSYLIGMEGFGEETLKMHFKLYEGYVKNINLLIGLIQDVANQGKDHSPEFGALKRRMGFEFDGMRLHEDYFGNLGGMGSKLAESSSLYKQITKDFGSFDKWKQEFLATGAIRGIGWVILYRDPQTNRLMNIWISEHAKGHLAGADPIVVMDVWEHAYLLDYGLNRAGYMEAFFKNIDWNVVQKRFEKEQDSSGN